MIIEGVIEVLMSRPAGRGKAWNIKVGDNWYGCGFQRPDIEKGDQVRFDAIQNDRGFWNVNGTINVTGKGQQQAQSPGRPQPQQSGNTGSMGKDDFWKEKEKRDVATQIQIRYQASRNAAIEVVKMALEHDCFSLGQKKSDKYDILMAKVDELTDRFNSDVKDVAEYGERKSYDQQEPAKEIGAFGESE